MSTFELHLQSATQYEKISDVISFVGEDDSGQFGILPYHARMMTTLIYGLARFQHKNNEIEYLALPSGMLYFIQNQLYINTRHYLRSKDYQTIITVIDKELYKEEEEVRSIKESLHRLDEEILKRLWDLKRQGLS